MLSEAVGTSIVGVVLLSLIAAIVAGLVKDRRKGKRGGAGCGRSRESCGYAAGCGLCAAPDRNRDGDRRRP
jgi:hypothetical protein